MREIPLTQGKVALVDDADFDWLNQWKWYAAKAVSNGAFYARRTINETGTSIHMHRAILGLEPGDPRRADRIRRDGTLDNRRDNLRIATQSQNITNSRKAQQQYNRTARGYARKTRKMARGDRLSKETYPHRSFF